MIAGYDHFLVLARRAQWVQDDVDLRPDAAAWPGLQPVARERLERLVAGFCVGEAGVAEHLGPFGAAAGDPLAVACFAAQERDEQRHSAFFDRVARDVLRAPGAAPADRRDALRGLLGADFLDLFERRLPEVAGGLVAGSGGLERAVGLYHMVLEGVVFTAGQLALLEALDEHPELPGLKKGMERVLRDERWHVGFGGRCLQDAGLDAGEIESVLCEGERAARSWVDATGAGHAETVVAMLRRRLSAVSRVRTTTSSF
ncbi:MAG: ribonucleoside-diphosphate reductase beta chain [Solirubrobacteraceae bacterium]|nr:ribonucleoside-diphosphate reductase beta chain [Solirubrobacteraceae bacterium]